MKIRGLYNFIGQEERLIYIGREGSWHQFAKISSPQEVWAEVLERDLNLIEETK